MTRTIEKTTAEQSVVFSIRLNAADNELMETVAELYGMSKADFGRQAIIETCRRMSTEEAIEAQVEKLRDSLHAKFNEMKPRLEAVEEKRSAASENTHKGGRKTSKVNAGGRP